MDVPVQRIPRTGGTGALCDSNGNLAQCARLPCRKDLGHILRVAIERLVARIASKRCGRYRRGVVSGPGGWVASFPRLVLRPVGPFALPETRGSLLTGAPGIENGYHVLPGGVPIARLHSVKPDSRRGYCLRLACEDGPGRARRPPKILRKRAGSKSQPLASNPRFVCGEIRIVA